MILNNVHPLHTQTSFVGHQEARGPSPGQTTKQHFYSQFQVDLEDLLHLCLPTKEEILVFFA